MEKEKLVGGAKGKKIDKNLGNVNKGLFEGGRVGQVSNRSKLKE